MCNLFGGPETVAHKLDVLSKHCAAVGRDPAEITVTHLSNAVLGPDRNYLDRWVDENRARGTTAESYAARWGVGLVDDQIGRYRALADAGVDVAIVGLPNQADAGAVERFGDVIGAFHTPP